MNEDMKQQTRAQAASVSVKSGASTAESAMISDLCYQATQETIDVEQVLAAEMRQKVVEFDMMIPDKEPNIDHIIDVYVKDVVIKSIDVIANKVVIRGDMKVKIMYVAALPNEPVHAFEKCNVKFMRDIDVEGALPEMKATADCTVEYVDYDFSDCEPRKVHITIVLKFWTRVTTTTEMDVLALSPVDQVGACENATASSSVGNMTNASQFKEVTTSTAMQNCAETVFPSCVQEVAPVQEAQVSVVEQEITAGESLSIEGTKGKVTANRVNLRTGPGTNYPSITKVNRGDIVTIQEQAFGWYKVILADKTTTGWIASWFVELQV